MNSFHVLLVAFFGFDDLHVAQEEWVGGGRTSRVTIGTVGVRGTPPVQGAQLVGWFQRFAEKLKEKQLRPGTNWVRLYYAQMQGSTVTCEVLLNNYVWEEVQSEMAAAAWPSGEAFYRIRVFLVIQVQSGGTVSPESAVAWLADLVAERQEFTEDEAYAAMAEAGGVVWKAVAARHGGGRVPSSSCVSVWSPSWSSATASWRSRRGHNAADP
jgi:hypothetical protein